MIGKLNSILSRSTSDVNAIDIDKNNNSSTIMTMTGNRNPDNNITEPLQWRQRHICLLLLQSVDDVGLCFCYYRYFWWVFAGIVASVAGASMNVVAAAAAATVGGVLNDTIDCCLG